MQERRKVRDMRKACTTCGSQRFVSYRVLISSGPTSDPTCSSLGHAQSLGLSEFQSAVWMCRQLFCED